MSYASHFEGKSYVLELSETDGSAGQILYEI